MAKTRNAPRPKPQPIRKAGSHLERDREQDVCIIIEQGKSGAPIARTLVKVKPANLRDVGLRDQLRDPYPAECPHCGEELQPEEEEA